jgi:hypothetical protein
VAADPKAVLHPEARAELREAVTWFRANAHDAMGFVEEVTRAIEDLANAPERWPGYVT